MPVALVSDTCHYLPAELVQACGIKEVSLYVHRGGEAIRESEISDYDDYYGRLASDSALPTTSQPSIGDFLAVYEPLIEAGHDIVSVHLSGGLSGTVRSAEQAREQLGATAERVHVVDSRTACGAEGLVLLAAAAALKRTPDASAQDIADCASSASDALQFLFAVDTLEYLRRGGRIGGAQAWLGSALKIKPILSLEGEITPVERVRTSRRALERMVALAESMHADAVNGWVIQHVQAPDVAAELRARCEPIFGAPPLFVSEIGPVIGTHVGPGLVGLGGVPSALVDVQLR
jgi:DegV family protein with EDD domain